MIFGKFSGLLLNFLLSKWKMFKRKAIKTHKPANPISQSEGGNILLTDRP
jgi:hypothetical protein